MCHRCCWPSSKSRRATLSRGLSSQEGARAGRRRRVPSLVLTTIQKSRRAALPRGHSNDRSTSGSTPPCAVAVADHPPNQGARHCLAAIQARTEARAGPRRRAPSLLLTILQIKAHHTVSRPFNQDGSTSGSTPSCAVAVADHPPNQGALHCLAAVQAMTETRAGPRRRAPSLLLTILQIKAHCTVSRPFKPGRKHERAHTAVRRRRRCPSSKASRAALSLGH